MDRCVIICTSPRSGSTMLCRLLAATGVAGRPDSYFHRPSLTAWEQDAGLMPAPGSTESDGLAAVMQGVKASGTTANGVFGLRLQRQSASYFMQKLQQLFPGVQGDAARIQAAFGRPVFVYLNREDKLAQAVSYLRARQSGLWHLHSDGSALERLVPLETPGYDATRIAAERAALEAQDRDWNTWFREARIAPLRLEYDDLSADPAGTVRQVLIALGQDGRAAQGLVADTTRLADDQSAEWIARFRADADG